MWASSTRTIASQCGHDCDCNDDSVSAVASGDSVAITTARNVTGSSADAAVPRCAANWWSVASWADAHSSYPVGPAGPLPFPLQACGQPLDPRQQHLVGGGRQVVAGHLGQGLGEPLAEVADVTGRLDVGDGGPHTALPARLGPLLVEHRLPRQ